VDPNKRKRLLLIGTIVCVGAWLTDNFVFTPLTNLWKERSVRIQELNENLDKSAAVLDREDSLNGHRDEMTQRDLPDRTSDAENAVLQAVNQWTSNSGLGVTSLKPRWTRIDKTKQAFEIQLDGNGDMETLMSFVFDLETSELPLRVEDLSITSQDETGTRLNLSLRFTGLVKDTHVSSAATKRNAT
jgi:hypothetical protein